jgi:nicotinamidase-related amidase
MYTKIIYDEEKPMTINICIDAQNDFITGALGTKEADEATNRIAEYLKTQDKNSIIFTQDTHYSDYSETSEGKNLPVEHCIKDTDGWMIDKRLQDFVCSENNADCQNTIIKKTFGYDNIAGYISEKFAGKTIDKIIIFGFCTDICVVSNALILKASYLETPIIIRADLSAGTTLEMHKKALDVMKSCQIIAEGE